MRAALAFSTVAAQVTYNSFGVDKDYMVYGGPTSDGLTVFTVFSSASGWFGVGVGGPEMENGILHVSWKNSTKGMTIVQSMGSPSGMPQPLPQQMVKIIPLQIPAPGWAKLAYSFVTPPPKGNKFMWAYSDSSPASMIDNINASYAQHTKYGSATADFIKLRTGVPISSGVAFPFVKATAGKAVASSRTTVSLAFTTLSDQAYTLMPTYVKGNTAANWSLKPSWDIVYVFIVALSLA